MASNERSLGWNTSTVNDGAAAYDTARMIAMELKTLGNGTLITGGNLALSGASSTLTISDGAAMINGYFYETTSASTISTTGLNGTYTLALISNASGGSYTVAQTAAATTSVLVSTVRMALCTSAQLTTIGAANYIAYGTVVVGATGLITSVSSFLPYAQTRQFPNTQWCTLSGGTASLTSASTYYDLAPYANTTPSLDGTITGNTTTGAISIRVSGLYTFSFYMKFDTNTTGTRKALIRNLATDFQLASAATLPLAGDSVYDSSVTIPITVTPGNVNTYYLQAWASTAGRSVNDSFITIARV